MPNDNNDSTAARSEFAELLDLLGIGPDERVAVCSQKPGGAFNGKMAPLKRAKAEALALSLRDESCVWFGVNPVAPPRSHKGRGRSEHVTRCVALFADIDLKTGGVADPAAADAIAKDISAALGQLPAAVVFSGHGGHPYWLLDADDDAWTLDTEDKRAAAVAVYHRFHRLCIDVAAKHGGRVDNVSELTRVLRVPGTFNRKDAGNPVSVELSTWPYGTAEPLRLAQVNKALDAAGVPEHTEDSVVLGEVISEPAGWVFGSETDPYVAAMVTGWATDLPAARHTWLVGQATRLACARRLGKITEANHAAAEVALGERFAWLLANHGEPRRTTPGEVASALAWGIARAAAMDDDQATDDLGLPTTDDFAVFDMPPEFDRRRCRDDWPPSASGGSGDTTEAADADAEAEVDAAPFADVPDDVLTRARQLWVDREARKLLNAHDSTAIVLPPVVSLDELLAADDEPVRMRIEQVWPSGGGKGSCAAMAGAGKTTLNGNLIRSLVDGDPFLGTFEVHETVSRIMVIDLEMTPSMMRRWLRRQGVVNTAAVVDVVNLRSKAHLFDMGNDKLREMWVRRIRDNGIEWVTFDCLKPVLDAMGLNENNEMGKFLTPFDAMLGEAGVSDVLVYHHTGHQNERARGDSMLLGWTDVNLKLVKPEPGADADRYFAADKVRDAEEPAPEGLLTFDKATGWLTYAGGDRVQTGKSEVVEKRLTEVLEVLADRHAEGNQGRQGPGHHRYQDGGQGRQNDHRQGAGARRPAPAGHPPPGGAGQALPDRAPGDGPALRRR